MFGTLNAFLLHIPPFPLPEVQLTVGTVFSTTRWEFSKSEKIMKLLPDTSFSMYFFLINTVSFFMFGNLSTQSLANLLICYTNFLQWKSSFLDIDMLHTFENTDESLVFLGCLVPKQWVSRHPTYLYYTVHCTVLYNRHNF